MLFQSRFDICDALASGIDRVSGRSGVRWWIPAETRWRRSSATACSPTQHSESAAVQARTTLALVTVVEWGALARDVRGDSGAHIAADASM
jgi:hypothetical protein